MNASGARTYARSSHRPQLTSPLFDVAPKHGSGVENPFEEIHEGPRLGGRRAPRWENPPQIERWKAPLRQNSADGSRSQFRAEHPFRRDGKADIGKHRSSYAFRRGHPTASELSRRNDQTLPSP